jgi:putative hydrolase of the HAD superfamily
VKRYHHVFFDLDHTLWDFRSNSRAALCELYIDLGLEAHGVGSAQEMIEEFEEINEALWSRFEAGGIDKAVLRVLRFRETLLRFGIRNDRLAREMGAEYLDRCPRRTALHQGVPELLVALQDRIPMHIITNGFAEVQRTKLESAGIATHFSVVLTSEEAGARKPAAKIFLEALRRAGADATTSLMIGNDPRTDLAGARIVGMDQAHFLEDGATADPLATFAFDRFERLREVLL